MTAPQTPTFGVADASFLAAGGRAGIEQLVQDFYRIMDQSPAAATVRQLYPQDLSLAREKLATFLMGWLGGPREYSEKFGSISIPQFHTRWQVTETERDAWLGCMAQAIARQPYSTAFADYLLTQLRVPAERIRQASHNLRASRPPEA
jgi:hemoglobin